MSSSSNSRSPRKNVITGVSLEPEVVRSLDRLAVQTGLSRSWVLNTIVRDYLRLMGERDVPPPLSSREAIIKL